MSSVTAVSVLCLCLCVFRVGCCALPRVRCNLPETEVDEEGPSWCTELNLWKHGQAPGIGAFEVKNSVKVRWRCFKGKEIDWKMRGLFCRRQLTLGSGILF